jgi:hypothetical protein
MKAIVLLIAIFLGVFGLMIFQLRSMKKHHPNAKLLIDCLKLISSEAVDKKS